MNKENGEIQMYVRQLIEGIPSGRNPRDFAVIRFSGDYRPHNIEDIPSVVFGHDEDQYALAATVKDEFAMFLDTTITLLMYVIAKKSPEDPAVYVLYPFSRPEHPDDFLDVKYIGEKIVSYAQKVDRDYPVFAVEYIPGFLKLQSEVYFAEQGAVQKFQTAAQPKHLPR